MTKTKISFHDHENVGAKIVNDWMKEMEFPDEDRVLVTKLVKHHQWRFYPDTHESTIRKWLERLGSEKAYNYLMNLRIADRAGNLANEDKPLHTTEHLAFKVRVEQILKKYNIIFFSELAVRKKDLRKLNIPKEKDYEILTNMLGIVRNKPERNTKEYLTSYIIRNYKEGK